MKRGGTRCAAAALMLLASALARAETPADLDSAKVEPAIVRVEGDTVYFTGHISEASAQVFAATVAPLERGQVTRLVVSSRGGDTVPGRRIGQWVHDMGLLVEVEKVCFSSCANYIFPAGRGRVIRADSFVGWHGNERAFEVDARRAGKTLEEAMRPMMEPWLEKSTLEDRDGLSVDAYFARQIGGMRQSIAEEGKYFAQLGLDDAFAACGVGDVLEKRPGFRDQWGWGFTLADMERLGLAHTSYLGDGAYEANSRFRKYLVPLTAEECVSLLR
jgi:hypothetical protein